MRCVAVLESKKNLNPGRFGPESSEIPETFQHLQANTYGCRWAVSLCPAVAVPDGCSNTTIIPRNTPNTPRNTLN